MDRKHLWRRIRRAWVTLGLATTVLFVGWSLIAYRASAAARIAIQPDLAERRDGFVGLVLIGSSHPRDVDLSALRVPVTKIVGTRDGLASRAEVEANRAKLPAETRWVWIEGGNHSHFGWYGFQPGDRRATIDAATQRATMIRAVIDALRQAAVAAAA